MWKSHNLTFKTNGLFLSHQYIVQYGHFAMSSCFQFWKLYSLISICQSHDMDLSLNFHGNIEYKIGPFLNEELEIFKILFYVMH